MLSFIAQFVYFAVSIKILVGAISFLHFMAMVRLLKFIRR